MFLATQTKTLNYTDRHRGTQDIAQQTQLMFHPQQFGYSVGYRRSGRVSPCSGDAARRGAFDDPDNYLPLARAVAAGDGFSLHGRPTAYRPPLYPLLLAPSTLVLGEHALWGIALLHLAMGAGTIWLTAVAAKISGLSFARSIFAAFVTACDPVLVWQSRSVMTETPDRFFAGWRFGRACTAGMAWASLWGHRAWDCRLCAGRACSRGRR